MRIDVRQLAALYTGWMSAEQLTACCDGIAGPPEVLALASTLFAGPTPFMADMF